MKNSLYRLFSRRILTRVLFAVACLATFLALFYAIENWRGQRAWTVAKSRLQAKGRNFDPAAFVPAPVPDDQNIFKAPGMECFIKGQSNSFSSRFQVAPSLLSARHYTNRTPVIAVEVRVVALDAPTNVSGADAVLNSADPGVDARALQLLGQALGPSVEGPAGNFVFAHDLAQTKPAQVLVRSTTPLSAEDLSALFPTNASATIGPAASRLLIRSNGSNSFQVVVTPPPGVIAGEYLAATVPFDGEFDLLRQALTRPYSRMEGDYEHLFAMPVPNFVLVRTVAQTLAQRAQCHLMLGQPEAAWKDLSLVREMCRLLSPKPGERPVTLVSAMIEVAVTGLYTQIVKDGLRLHAWREPQLAAIQAQLGQVRLLPLMSGALDSEMVAVCALFENSSPEEIGSIFSGGPARPDTWERFRNPLYLFCKLAPRGWVHQTMASIALHNDEVMATMDCANNRISSAAVDSFTLRVGARMKRSSRYTWLAVISIPNFAKALQALARNQTRAHEALAACGLERHRLANGCYPKTLENLVPGLIGQLPHDLFTGKPLRYRLMPDGSYLLYSIGWNETDEGGLPGKGNLDGDWVWNPEAASF